MPRGKFLICNVFATSARDARAVQRDNAGGREYPPRAAALIGPQSWLSEGGYESRESVLQRRGRGADKLAHARRRRRRARRRARAGPDDPSRAAPAVRGVPAGSRAPAEDRDP